MAEHSREGFKEPLLVAVEAGCHASISLLKPALYGFDPAGSLFGEADGLTTTPFVSASWRLSRVGAGDVNGANYFAGFGVKRLNIVVGKPVGNCPLNPAHLKVGQVLR